MYLPAQIRAAPGIRHAGLPHREPARRPRCAPPSDPIWRQVFREGRTKAVGEVVGLTLLEDELKEPDGYRHRGFRAALRVRNGAVGAT